MPNALDGDTGRRRLRNVGQTMTTRSDADIPPESARTPQETRLCAVCDAPLTGRRRQAQHCSDRCRAEGARMAHRRCIAAHLDGIAEAVEALRQELRLQEDPGAPERAAIKPEKELF